MSWSNEKLESEPQVVTGGGDGWVKCGLNYLCFISVRIVES
jgi:hypothetical protein